MPKNIKYNNKGITLIALCITIIILSILATITLAALSSDNGIIIKAHEAKNSAEGSQQKDDLILKNIIGYSNEITVNNIGNNTSSGGSTGGNNTTEHTHTWDSGVITIAATCIDTGTKKYTCTSCGTTKTETIAALGGEHEWGWDTELGAIPCCTLEEKWETWCNKCSVTAPFSEWHSDNVHDFGAGDDYYGCPDCGLVMDDIAWEEYYAGGADWFHNSEFMVWYPIDGVEYCIGCGETRTELGL